MDYERKYKEALEKAKEFYTLCKKCEAKDTVDFLEDSFPELKENEDEKIRGAIIHFISHTPTVPKGIIGKETMITWLEKQGAQNPYSGVSFEYNGRIWGMCARDNGVEILVDGEIKERVYLFNRPQGKSALETLKEEKADNQNCANPVVKIEPKFKVGDWVVDKEGHIFKIMRVDNDFNHITYACRPIEENSRDWASYSENDIRLWDITEDAKDGDVLACPLPKGCESGEQIFIFKGINSRDYVDNCIEYYCRICEGVFYENENGYMGTTSSPLYPATKEQRDALFAKIKEAGYEWDAEKKELKKSADKQKFKVGDYVVISTTKGDKVVQIASVEYLKDGYPSYITTEGRWFGNGTKARILTDKDMETITIPERSTIVKKIKSWSEDDETKMRAALAFIKSEFPKNGDEEIMEGTIEWLKSLKQRIGWKPSDAQIEALGVATDICSIPEKQYNELNKLYQDLKKLTE